MQVENQDFTQFIEFGNVFDRDTREYLVKYIRHKIQATAFSPAPPKSVSPYLQHLESSLDMILAHKQTLSLAQENENIAKQIIEDTLSWIRKSMQKASKENPHQEETEVFDAWQGKPANLWVASWHKLTSFLKNIYSKEELDVSFYAKKFNELCKNIDNQALLYKKKDYSKELAQLEILIEDLLKSWENLLIAKSLEYELANIDKQREEFCSLLYAKIDEFVKLLSIITPFAAEVGRYWDMSRGLWQEASFDILQKYSQILEREESIQALADILGKLREAEIEIEEELYENVITRKTWVDDYEKKSEVGGVYESDDLPRVLPSEVGMLGYQETESVFLKKYADQQLLSFELKGKKLVESNNIQYLTQQKQRRKERGPFIICIDTSGSMEGLPEQIAKTLCFAILKMASREQRNCFLISFSIGIKTINLLDLTNSMDEIVKFLSMSFHGGTDVTPALIAAINTLQENDYKEADILMVSDFVMFEIRDEVLKKIRKEQSKGTNFHSLTISSQANPEIIYKFDNNWRYDPEDRAVVKQLAEDLEQLNKTF